MTQAELIAKLPGHLRQFVKEQEYSRYSPRDHAVWRFLLHRLAAQLSETAHPVYLEGLRQAGISLEHIPGMDEMNAGLGEIGWGAVVVDGFIPPAIFMEFQARRILPIALGMRAIDHMLYTPAPDIVHEAAGHAPFIVDADYAEFLQRFGEVGMKALSTQADDAVYEAIRHLSIVKEAPGASAEDIARAEAALAAKLDNKGEASEAALLARLHWWTVEYGLVGEVDGYKIFGAGLLSSLGENVNCLDDRKIKKLPLTVDCVNTDYDITSEQPQLFVTKSCKHLTQVLESFADGMAFKQGGAAALRKAIDGGAVATAVYNSGLQVSGRFTRLLTDAVGNANYLGTTGPTQLATDERELPGHGIERHPKGFGSPVGQVKNLPRCLSLYTVDELSELGIRRGERLALEFVSGVTVSGRLARIERREHRTVLMTWTDCTVTAPDRERLFDPAWGDYDMAVGECIVSVFGGTADRERFSLYQRAAEEGTLRLEVSGEERQLFALYQRVRDLRDSGKADNRALVEIAGQLRAYPREWLLRFELLELMSESDSSRAGLMAELQALRSLSDDHCRLIDTAVRALASHDPLASAGNF